VTTEIIYSVADFMRDLGATDKEAAVIADEAAKYNFRYRLLEQAERDQIILGILEKLNSFTKVGAHREQVWENCWSDTKNAFLNAKSDLNALDPVFMGAHPIMRLHGDYARPDDPKFETHWFRVMRRWLFARYLTGEAKAFEFGCGSGFNLAAASQMFPDIELTGLDWSQSAVQLVDSIGQSHGFNLKGRHFDFFNPDPEVSIGRDSVAMTFAALEQTGPRWIAFAEWLLAKRPKLVINMEPILEFYNPRSLVDDLAIRYHSHRGYLSGYYSWIKAQADSGKVEVMLSRRPGFGSLYHEGYSLVVWRPL
jgi:SAM-dependent methyltransferase